MISKLIEEFQEISDQHIVAVDKMDKELTSKLNANMDNIWNALISSDPKSADQAYALVKFLLDSLKDTNEADQIDLQIKKKILSLIQVNKPPNGH